MFYKLGPNKELLPVQSVLEWAAEFENSPRQIRVTVNEDLQITVSTVFLGMEHGYSNGEPLVFETMIFGGPLDGYQDRYTSYAAALEGHEKALKEVQLATSGFQFVDLVTETYSKPSLNETTD